MEKKTTFKSYYVVWKPVDFKAVQLWKNTFKSYYVVWKPEKAIKYLAEFRCLNRTM